MRIWEAAGRKIGRGRVKRNPEEYKTREKERERKIGLNHTSKIKASVQKEDEMDLKANTKERR